MCAAESLVTIWVYSKKTQPRQKESERTMVTGSPKSPGRHRMSRVLGQGPQMVLVFEQAQRACLIRLSLMHQ